jgi:hypothetical protein
LQAAPAGHGGGAGHVAAEDLKIVAMHKAVFTQPPSFFPINVRTDAAFLGNSDLLAAFTDAAEFPRFQLTTNNLCGIRHGGGPRLIGRVNLEMPSLTGASYGAEQDFLTGSGAAHGDSGIYSISGFPTTTLALKAGEALALAAIEQKMKRMK